MRQSIRVDGEPLEALDDDLLDVHGGGGSSCGSAKRTRPQSRDECDQTGAVELSLLGCLNPRTNNDVFVL